MMNVLKHVPCRESSASTAKDFSDAAALTAQAQELKKAALDFKREGRNTEAIAYVSSHCTFV